MNVPSGYTALDMVGFTDQGVYNSATAYVKNDIVHYNGNLWRCLVDDTTAVTPTEGANWTVFLAEPTSAAEDIIAPVEATATSTRIYSVENQLILGDVLYVVTRPINIGDTLTVGTNIAAADTIVEQLAEKADSTDLAAVATSGEYSDLNNLPTLGTAAAKNVPASGDASTTEVVMGNDTRLTNARNAADVPAWAKTPNKPTYNGSEIETSTAKTGTAQQSISDTVAAGTSMDNVVKIMLNNDKTLDTNVTSLKETLTNQINYNGAKNYVPADLVTETRSGITATRNSNSSYSVSGTKTITGVVLLTINNTKILLKANQSYTLSGGAADLVQVILRDEENSTWYLDADGHSVISKETSKTFTNGNTDTYVNVCIRVNTNDAVNATVYPMLRLASDPDDTYVPYAMTNKQLTEFAEQIEGAYIPIGGLTTITYTPSSDDTYMNKINALYALLQNYQATLADDERFSVTGFTLGTSTHLSNARLVYLSKTSNPSFYFYSALTYTISMVIRSIYVSNTSNDHRLSKVTIDISTGAITASDEIETSSTAAVSFRIQKYKVIS